MQPVKQVKRVLPFDSATGQAIGAARESGVSTPTEDKSVFQEARGNLAFLLSMIRCGEQLSPDEEANVARVINRLTDDQAKIDRILVELIKMIDVSNTAAIVTPEHRETT